MKLLGPTLSEPAAPRPEPDEKNPQHLCPDKGYVYPIIREQVAELGYVLHLRSRGEEKEEKATIPGIPGTAMGGRMNPLPDQPVSPPAHTLGEESGKLRSGTPDSPSSN